MRIYGKVIDLMKAKPYLWLLLSLFFLPYSIFEFKVLFPLIYGILRIGVDEFENFFFSIAKVFLKIGLLFLKGDFLNLFFVVWLFISVVLISVLFSIYFKLIKISLLEDGGIRKIPIKSAFMEFLTGSKMAFCLLFGSSLFVLWTISVLLPPAPWFLQGISILSLFFQWILMVSYFFGWVTFVFIHGDVTVEKVRLCVQRNFSEIFFHTTLLFLFLILIMVSLFILNSFMLERGMDGFVAAVLGVYLSSIIKGFVFCFCILFMFQFFHEKYQRGERKI
jgi:hypothetical protein